jgi:HD-like signal output (HDOD) protein
LRRYGLERRKAAPGTADKHGVVTPLAQKTIKHVTEKLESGESGGLSEIVELIQKLSSNAFETSVQELAVLIGKDIVVTAKVITAANTIGYNPTGVEVATIAQAIQVIGFNKIRQLAVSLLLVENANRTLNAKERREIAALALCSGLMAESVMSQRGSLPPEQAFVCASLRNYGHLLMTAFMIDEYRRARLMTSSGSTEDEAFNDVFGLTPLELGYHLLASAHLPEPILKSLRALPVDALRLAKQRPEMELLALADLSVKVCELALRSDVGALEFGMKASALASRSGKIFGLDADALVGLLQQTGQQLNEFAHTFGLNALAEQFAPRINARVRGADPEGFGTPSEILKPVPKAARTPAAPHSEGATDASAGAAPERQTSSPTPASVPIPADPLDAAAETRPARTAPPFPPGTEGQEAAFQRAIQTGIEQLAGLLDMDPLNMSKVYDVLLRAASQGFATNDCVLWVRDERSAKFLPKLGSGKFFDAIRTEATVREGDRNVFGVCIQRAEDVLIYDAGDPKIVPHLPPWMQSDGLASFVLLPVQENKRPFAVLLAGWREKKTVGFTVSQIRQVRSMLKLAGTARRLSDLQ